METKKDIYNLWIQYTTKNDETFFRQFIYGFVQIWENQLNIDFDKPPLWNTIKSDLGPHLSRLPDELLPAIGKFLIIAKDSVQQNGNIQPSKEELDDTTLLIKCLIVMCRHFENINTIANYEYISSIITLSINIIQLAFKNNVKPTISEIQLIKSACQLIEVIYDPYLTWRNFLHGNYAQHTKINSSLCQLHVEIVPFIYDCFQSEKILNLPEIGINLINTLGSIISGSQNCLSSVNKTTQTTHCSSGGGGGGFGVSGDTNISWHNGMRAISPATVTMLIDLISKWECNSELRLISLKCYAIMAIVLQRSSPVERQIELVTICQFYLNVIQTLMTTKHFLPKPIEEKFEISNNQDDLSYIDVNAFISFIDNIEIILSEKHSQLILCSAIIECNIFSTLTLIMKNVNTWDIDLQSLASSIIRCICFLTRISPQMCNLLHNFHNMEQLFNGLQLMGKPTQKLLNVCLKLAYNDEKLEIIFGNVIIKLLEWIKNMHENEQIYLSENLLKICLQNFYCKTIVSQEQIIKTICKTLQNYNSLNSKCAIDLIKLIEEIGKYSISSIELKNIFWLLRNEMHFIYRRQLLQAVATISLNNISNNTICNEFLDIQYKTDGITVPEIRKWTMSGSYGYIFHAWIRFDILNGKDNDNISNDARNFRRVILSTLTNQGHGFEIFLQRNGQLTVGVLTKKEYLAAAVTKVNMLDNRWHLITIGIIPSKRPFSFTQISVYIDGLQKLGATFKFAGITEPFSYCTIGRISHEITKQSRSSFSSQLSDSSDCSSPIPSDSPKSGMFPSFIDRSFIPQIVSQVPNYFSLPRSTSSNDPNIKAYPIGMQNNVFGEPMCLKGQLGCMVLAEPNTNIKLILDAGYNFATVISQDIEPYDPTSKFIFCYSPISCYDGFCIDLVPGNKYNGHVVATFCRTIKIQDSINSIGGIYTLLPILDIITKSKENIDILFTNDNNNNSSSPKEVLTPTSSSNNDVDINDWEVLVSTKYSEWKMIQNSVACFLCLIRYFIQDHDINQAHLLKSDGISIIGAMLSQCNSNIIDVNVLMAMQLLVESIQNQIPAQNVELLENMYTDIVFNFKIWSKCEFQIIIGHIQYINPMIKDNRKYFRNKFGIQYFLDIIRQYFAIPINLSPDDGLAIRMALLDIIKYYLQKDINIKEVNIILSYIASLKYEHLIVEILELLINYMKYKTCKDQLFLLLHEPQTAEILYILLIDKSYSNELHLSLLRFFHCLLETNRVSKKHKSTIRLHDSQVDSLYPGLFSFMLPFNLNNTNALNLIDQILTDDTEKSMSGLLYIIHHLSTANINLKLEITQRLLPLTFDKSIAYFIAKQIGWQETIPRLLIKKHITNTGGNINKTKTDNDAIGTGSGGDSDGDITSYEDNNDLLNQMDLMTFDEKTLELSEHERIKDHHLLLTEFQASVSEAANVIEHEIKGMAETVAGKVGENISSVYSMLRQTTCDIQEHIETAIGAPIDSKLKSYSSFSTQSSDSTSEENIYTKSIDKDDGNKSLNNDESIANKEENLIYLVTNILFNVLWNGIDNNNNDAGDLWKQRGQVIASINLLGLNNELYCSHLKLRLRILEMGIQSVLKDLNEAGHNVQHQQNASQLLRLVYDLMILDPTEDEMDKCSELLFEGILHLFDALMIFPKSGTDDWSEMTRLCLGLLLKCSHHPNSEIVAKATARLHEILQSRSTQNPQEFGYLIYSVNRVLNVAIEVGNPEQYSYLMPIMRALLDKSRYIFSLSVNVPGLPKTESGPTFFHEFQMYGCTKEWIHFVERKLKPLYDSYQNDVNTIISEPLNTFWAECYESCKLSSQKRAKLLTDSRRRFQQKIMMPWKIRKNEENTRLNGISSLNKTKENQVERRWKSIKRFLHGSRGAWSYDIPKEEYWRHSNHENSSRMRLKLEPSLYHDTHISASNLRDNTANNIDTRRLSTEFGSSITQAVIQDMLTEDEVILLEEEMKNIAENQQQEISVEKIVISQECELVSLMTRIKGRLEVTSRMFIFIDLNPKEDGEKYDFRFPITQIKEVHLRKFNLCRSALEIFLINQTSYFLNFTPKTRNKIFTKILSLQPPNILYGSGRSPSELLKASGLTQRWMNREISNFEYLMHLNTIAGRSYNDLSQYPIFPWILSDYTSEILDLTNPSSFRDLSKPIGVVNSKNEKEVRAKYESFEDPSGIIPRFHYGTHYSNSAGVLHYLIRVEPFTSLHIELQSGRFDVADRQFHSIPQTFKLLMDNANDVKELIPEFFYFPEFLKNMNKFDLGILQVTKERVDDVILPPWANTPEDFIEIHRRALESEYVSQNLHNWIDLIFGYKQKGPKAVEALNVFYYCSYEGAVDLDKIENQAERLAVEGMINNFGQTPSQLLREPHPKRLTHEEALIKLLRQELRKSEFTSYLDRIISTTCELSTDKNPIVFLSVPRSPPRSFLQTNPDVLVAISKNGILGCNSWLSHDKENGFHIELDPTTTNIKNRKKLGGPFHPAINLHSQLFAVSLDGRYLYAGGIWDNSLKVFNVNRGKNVASITHHLDIITCLALDNCGSFLVTGSKDCTCIVWSLNNTQSLNNSNINNNININQTTQTSGAITGHTQANTNNSLTPRPLNTLYGHDSTVSCVAIMTELDIVVSGSIDGTVNVHTIIEGQYVRTLSPMGCTGLMIEITYLALSYQGHIAFSALDDTSHSVHVYSINGSHLGSKYVSGRVTGLTTASDFLVVSDDAGDITLSRLYGLKPVFDIPLHIPIQTVIVTPGNTHILAPLRDGKLAVIGISTPTPIKKHSVLNV